VAPSNAVRSGGCGQHRAASTDFITYQTIIQERKQLRRVVLDECQVTFTASDYRPKLKQLVMFKCSSVSERAKSGRCGEQPKQKQLERKPIRQTLPQPSEGSPEMGTREAPDEQGSLIGRQAPVQAESQRGIPSTNRSSSPSRRRSRPGGDHRHQEYQ
jgi:hypothetical protein